MTTSSGQPQSEAGSSGPYAILGVQSDASFDTVQAARQARLAEAGDDPLVRARVEAAYDAVLMERLKERQQGRVSTAARSASVREQQPAAPPPRLTLPALPKVTPPAVAVPALGLGSGRQLWFPLAVSGVLLALLLLVPAASPELLLALATAMAVISLQWRLGRLPVAIGWSLGLLCVGLLVGGLLAGLAAPALSPALPLSGLQLQSLPVLLLLLLGALLIGAERR
jgi:hypothetical protein